MGAPVADFSRLAEKALLLLNSKIVERALDRGRPAGPPPPSRKVPSSPTSSARIEQHQSA